jgi:hypothetical protein
VQPGPSCIPGPTVSVSRWATGSTGSGPPGALRACATYLPAGENARRAKTAHYAAARPHLGAVERTRAYGSFGEGKRQEGDRNNRAFPQTFFLGAAQFLREWDRGRRSGERVEGLTGCCPGAAVNAPRGPRGGGHVGGGQLRFLPKNMRGGTTGPVAVARAFPSPLPHRGRSCCRRHGERVEVLACSPALGVNVSRGPPRAIVLPAESGPHRRGSCCRRHGERVEVLMGSPARRASRAPR